MPTPIKTTPRASFPRSSRGLWEPDSSPPKTQHTPASYPTIPCRENGFWPNTDRKLGATDSNRSDRRAILRRSGAAPGSPVCARHVHRCQMRTDPTSPRGTASHEARSTCVCPVGRPRVPSLRLPGPYRRRAISAVTWAVPTKGRPSRHAARLWHPPRDPDPTGAGRPPTRRLVPRSRTDSASDSRSRVASLDHRIGGELPLDAARTRPIGGPARSTLLRA